MLDPRFIGPKLEEDKEMQNIPTYTQILALTVITGFCMPGLLENSQVEQSGTETAGSVVFRRFHGILLQESSSWALMVLKYLILMHRIMFVS
jgi:hypothetical protein